MPGEGEGWRVGRGWRPLLSGCRFAPGLVVCRGMQNSAGFRRGQCREPSEPFSVISESNIERSDSCQGYQGLGKQSVDGIVLKLRVQSSLPGGRYASS